MTDTASQRILIVRLSAIGDTVLTLPLAAALKKNRPDRFIGWVVEEPASPLVVDNPLVDWSYVLPKGWLKSFSLVRELTTALREQHFDVAFDAQGLSKSAIAAWLSGAALRVGFARGQGREIAPMLDTRLIEPENVHLVKRTLELLKGIDEEPPGDPEFVLPPCPDADKTIIDAFLADETYANGFVVMGPWGTYAAKCWPLSRYLQLADDLYEGWNLPTLVLGHGAAERGAVELLLAGSEGKHARLAPEVSLLGVTELARRARLFVGGDSFPTHVAGAVGCPTVALFAVIDPERVKPLGKNSRAVYERLTLLTSSRDSRRLDQSNMESLGVLKVKNACEELLSSTRVVTGMKG